MKHSLIKLIIVLACLSGLLMSCSKSPERVLPNKNGKWKAVITNHVTSTAGFDTSAVNETEFTFLKDGTGSYIDLSAGGVTFTWTYSSDSKKITYQRTGYTVIVLDVTVMERKHEQWHTVSTEIIGLDSYSTDLTVDLTKSD